MRWFRFGAPTAWVLAMAVPAWALSDGDTCGVWIQAPVNQRVQVTNILSRDLRIDPAKLQQCLD